MLKQNLSQKMLQKLSPQQIQLMKLLQIPTATLEQRIKEELEANPALEEGEEVDDFADAGNTEDDLRDDERGDELSDDGFELDEYWEEYAEEDPGSYRYKADLGTSEEEDKEAPIALSHSFHEHLEDQIGLLDFASPQQELIAHQIVGSIDEDGYLRRDPEAIVDDLLFSMNVAAREEEVEEQLKRIQRFDPPGTGARDLQECLSIQLHLKLDDQDDNDPFGTRVDLLNAASIIDDHFDEFSKKHFSKLQRKLELDEDDLKDAVNEILKLNPKPASGYSGGGGRTQNQYVVPDFIIINRDGELELSLNSRNAPDLHINDQYRDMLQTYKATTQGRRANSKEKEAILFIKQKIDSAKWFIDAIRQRQETMYRTMYTILQYQYDFFLTGDERRLKPMILKDIADVTGYDISTISRVANSKFVQTEFGTKSLKEFFSESMQNQDGEEVSTLEIKKILQDIIDAENKKKPLSDQKLMAALEEKGYNIARRTVAKYREQLNIPVARLRKEL